jgi:hypothetical protein
MIAKGFIYKTFRNDNLNTIYIVKYLKTIVYIYITKQEKKIK